MELLKEISKLDEEIIVQIDEPLFSKDNKNDVLSLIQPTYEELAKATNNIKIIVTTYFEHSNEATKLLVNSPIWGIGLDFVHGCDNKQALELINKSDKKLIAGVVDGRNIWRNDIKKTLQLLIEISNEVKKDKIIVSSSCSLLHSPYSLKYENNLDMAIKNWLSFACEKLEEVSLLTKLFF